MPRDLNRASAKYRSAMTSGLVPTGRGGNVAEQTESWRRAAERTNLLSQAVCSLLQELGVDPKRYCEYLGFAFRLDRLRRHYTQASLRLATEELILTWSARRLERPVLESARDLVLSLDAEVADGRSA